MARANKQRHYRAEKNGYIGTGVCYQRGKVNKKQKAQTVRLAECVAEVVIHLTSNSRIAEAAGKIKRKCYQEFLSGRLWEGSIPKGYSLMIQL